MKTLKLIAAGIILLGTTTAATAQISVNLNIGTAPVYHNNARVAASYYYIPDIQSYYDVRNEQYIYLNGGSWVRSRSLPRHYSNYNVNTGYKVVLNDYHGSTPYRNFNNDRTKYKVGYRGASDKVVINRTTNTTVVYNDRNDSKNDRYYAKKYNDKKYDKKYDKHDNRR